MKSSFIERLARRGALPIPLVQRYALATRQDHPYGPQTEALLYGALPDAVRAAAFPPGTAFTADVFWPILQNFAPSAATYENGLLLDTHGQLADRMRACFVRQSI